MKEIELIGLRGKREKHFLQENGNIVAKVYDDDIHFNKNGKFEEIDNRLKLVDKYYTNNQNTYKVYFNTNSRDDLLSVEKDNNYLKMYLINSNYVSVQKNEKSNILSDSIVYKDILNKTDLEYTVLPNRIKEQFVIKENDYDYKKIFFYIETNLLLKKSDKKIVAFNDNQEIFIIENPYMIDKNGVKNNNLDYNLIEEKGNYYIELCLDIEWLNNAEFPVIIDPTIIDGGTNNNVYDTFIYPGDSGIDRNSLDYLKAGVERINNNDVVNRSLIKFDLPTIGTGSQIISANLKLIGYPYTPNTFVSDIVNVHRITEDWDEQYANWNQMNNKYDSRVEASFNSIRSFVDIDGNISTRLNGCNITSLVKKWYSNTPNYGIMLKLNKEQYRNDIIPMFFSKDNSVVGTDPKPILEITYRNQNGLENYMNYFNNSFTNGNTYLNSYNGNLVASFELGELSGYNSKTQLNLIYNTNDVILENNIGFGKGYMLNFQQIIKNVGQIGNSSYLAYTDEDGTIHYFKLSDGKYIDEDGSGMFIIDNNSNYILEDKQKNKYYFTIINNIGYLSRIEYKSGNVIDITYNNQKLITCISNNYGQEMIINYQPNIITVTCPSKTVTLILTNNKISSLSNLTGNTIFEYDNNDLLCLITDENGTKVGYEYYDEVPHKIRKITEYGLNNVIGKYYNIEYNFNSTVITDNNNRIFVLTYNDFGNLVSYSNLNSIENLSNAYGTCQRYINNQNDDSIKLRNKIVDCEFDNKYIKNYLLNSSFEESNIDFYTYDDVSITRSNINSKYGLYSLLLSSTENQSSVFKTVTVPKGKYYTFSAYVLNDCNINIGIGYIDNLNNYIENRSNIIYPVSDFLRHDITIYYPEDAIGNLNIIFYMYNNSNVYIDGIQLEEGQVANNYNMLDNSDFSNGLSDWTLSANEADSLITIPTSDVFSIVDIDSNNSKALKVAMSPNISSGFNKRFYINGKAGDTYNISFWYKNEGFPTLDSDILLVSNNMLIYFDYLDQSSGHGIPAFSFNPNEKKWQYFSQSFTAEADFDYIELRFFQSKNANNFYITNMSLIQDIKPRTYNYDSEGNVTKINMSSQSYNEFKYNSKNRLVTMTDPLGKDVTYEYDNDNNNLLSCSSKTGITNVYKYDNIGNKTLHTIRNKTVKNLTEGQYRMRLNGQDKYIRIIDNNVKIGLDNCSHDYWVFESVGEKYKIKHKIINKYLTVSGTSLILADYNQNNSLFSISKKDNGSHTIKNDAINKYLKVNDNNELEFDIYQADDYHFEFFIEGDNNRRFIENKYVFTSDGKKISYIIDQLLNKTSFEFNSNSGLIKSITNAKNVKTEYEYNNKNQLIGVSKGNSSLLINYNNNLITKITKGQKQFNFIYDNFLNNNMIKIGNNITLISNSYSNDGSKLLSSTYGNNDIVSFEYDTLGRNNKIIKMDNTFEKIYDNTGKVSKVKSNDLIRKYIVDTYGRLREFNYNNLKSKFQYDMNNNITNIDYILNDYSNSVAYSYNHDDLVTDMNFNNKTINYNYDELGRLISKSINSTYNTMIDYVSLGNRNTFLVKSINNQGDIYSYSFDSLGNITHIYHNGIIENYYKYDDNEQLVYEKNYLLRQIIKYKYDTEGNITSKIKYDMDSYSVIENKKYKYDDSNWEDLLTCYDGKNILYDNIGNPVSIGNDIILEWINGHELKRYVDNYNNIYYKYDDKSIRRQKIVNGVETNYFLESNRIIIEQTGNNKLYYIYDSNDDLIAFKYNNDLYYYIKNAQNDIIGIMDSNYNVVAKYYYDSWGKILFITDGNNMDISANPTHIANINPFRYRSYYYDKETKLYYLINRYYNPEICRFINADPIIGSSEEMICYNLFAYANNNPINIIDKDGLGFLKWVENLISTGWKKTTNFISSSWRKIKNAFVFDVGTGVGADNKVSFVEGYSIVDVGYSVDDTYKLENGKWKEGSETSISFNSHGLGYNDELFHEYHYVSGNLKESISHSNMAPFYWQINNCDHTEHSSYLSFEHKNVTVQSDNKIFIGPDINLHMVIGFHVKIGFYISW